MTTTKTLTILWQGKSGTDYKYYIYPIGTIFKSEPGNYVFAKESSPGKWRAIYIGETSNLNERFDDHHKMPCIRRNGATHIHVHINSVNKTLRVAEETDLTTKWVPTCNG